MLGFEKRSRYAALLVGAGLAGVGFLISTPSGVSYAEDVEVIEITGLVSDPIMVSATGGYDDMKEEPAAAFNLPQFVAVSAIKDGWIPLLKKNDEQVYTEALFVERKRRICDIAPSQANKNRTLGTGLGAGEGC